MGTKRKLVDAEPDEPPAPRKSEPPAPKEPARPRLSTTSSKRAAPSKAPKLSDAARDSLSPPRRVQQEEEEEDEEERATSVTISRPLDPTPALHTLPLDESFCPSGFNMLEILMRVATRPRPVIDIGAVDFSCAFCVCDVTQPDLPIVYCSEGFEKLTGYTEAEIMGQNCRFLQTPGGKSEPGRPNHDANSKILQDLRGDISRRVETQHSILNYRKDGTCFQNLVTMIPVAWDSPDIRYYVGFQADAGTLGR